MSGSWFRASGVGCRVPGFEYRVSGSRVGIDFRVSWFEFRVLGIKFRGTDDAAELGHAALDPRLPGFGV